jgi:Family of unknown function (DUF5317)
MRIMLASLTLSILVGYVLGGRLANLGHIRLHWTGLAVVGFALQWVAGPGTVIPRTCLFASFILLIVFALKNIRVFGFPIILVGIALNFLVIGLNLGMPVAPQALQASGQGEFLDDLINNPYPKHHVLTDEDRLSFLGDVIALPAPIRQAISIGDIFTYAGVGVVIVAAMRSPAARREDESKDLPDEAGGVRHVGS